MVVLLEMATGRGIRRKMQMPYQTSCPAGGWVYHKRHTLRASGKGRAPRRDKPGRSPGVCASKSVPGLPGTTMVERKSELKRRYHRKSKMAKLKARLAAAKDARDREAIIKKIHVLSPWWVEPAPKG